VCLAQPIGRGKGCKGFAKLIEICDRFSSGREAGAAGANLVSVTPPTPPTIQLINTPDYRESYANSVQMRVNLWDFFLLFGRASQASPDNVAIHNFQGIYLSPQQAKAVLNLLQQNVSQYEAAFGEIKLEPRGAGIVQ
jgi:hypothetical protein